MFLSSKIKNMKILKLDIFSQEELINVAISLLEKGSLVVVPSDTVYGLAVDATNPQAVSKLIEFKKRPPGKPISVFVGDFKMAKDLVFVNKKQEAILKQLLPGPFTIVLPSKGKVVPALESEKKTLGIRLINFEFITKLCQQFKKPITATSANISGDSPHYSIESFLKKLPKTKTSLVDLIIDFGNLPPNKPSTVIDLTASDIKILRKGDLNLKSEKKFISETPAQTKKIANFVINKLLKKEFLPLVFLIEGPLGVGKTIFVKGLAAVLEIREIISPSFVTWYEYNCFHPLVKKFYHLDFYFIEKKEEFDYLGLEKIFKEDQAVIAIEWAEKAGSIMEKVKKAKKLVYIKLKYLSSKKREIEIFE